MASATQINLTWTAATDNVGVTGYRVERCQGIACVNFVEVGQPTGTSFGDTGLTAAATYRYQVRATDAVGNLGPYSAIAGATTQASDTTPPTAPSGVTATAAGTSQITLSWTAATDNIGVTGYAVERCQGTTCTTFVQIATPTGTTYSDTGLLPASTYRYQVRATDAAGNFSGYSNIASATAAATGRVAAYAFDAGTGTTTADASGNGLTGTLAGATWTPAGKYGNALAFDGMTSYVDLGNPIPLQLTGSMTWSAWVFATGNPPNDGQIIAKSAGSDGWKLKTSPDTGPHTFAVAVSPNGSTHAQRYSTTTRVLNTWYHVAGVYNATAQTLDIYVNGVLDNGVLSGTVPAALVNSPQNVNIGRRPAGYYFQGIIDEVRIYNRALSAAEVATDMNTPVGSQGSDTTPPTAPAGVTATVASATQINLTWTAATDNVGVTGYRVERCQGVACVNFVEVGQPTGTSFGDTGLTAAATYRYQVRATDAVGNLGPYSAIAGATTQASDTTPPTAPSGVTATAAGTSQITLSWTAATDNIGVTGYAVERCQGTTCTTFVQIATPTGTTYSDTGLLPASTYRYQVRATDAAGNFSGYSNIASATAAATGRVAAYAFDAGTGTTTADASGNGLTGTLAGATWTPAGKYGNALAFDGMTSYVDLGNPIPLQLTGSMTWSAWVFATGNPPNDGQIIAKSAGSDGWQLKTTPDTGPHTFGVAVSPNGSTLAQRYSTTTRVLNTWYHVAGVYNATAQTLDIYVNGVLDNGVLSGTVPAALVNSPQNVNIGRRPAGYYFQGIIDEVRIYNRALSAAEIQADMATPIGT